MVYAGSCSESFGKASRHLQELADIIVSDERIRRATLRVGQQRIASRELLKEAFLAKSIPEQTLSGPADQEAPQIACIMSDGGRYQLLIRRPAGPAGQEQDAGEAKKSNDHWRESRIATLLSMNGPVHHKDPMPTLPSFLKDVSIAKKLAEIGRVSGENRQHDTKTANNDSPPWPRPTIKKKEVIASRENWHKFGDLLASRAWYAGFAKSTRKVFVSDGAAAIEGVQQRWFSDYVSVLDIMHAYSYALAAARAGASNEKGAWARYVRWAEWLWAGQVDQVITELLALQEMLGTPPADPSENDPREIIRRSTVYYQNHRGRMNYPEYRRLGYPLSSAVMESTVKQVNRRVKGSEKFWSCAGGESILTLRGEYLSDSQPMNAYWQHAAKQTDGQRTYLAA